MNRIDEPTLTTCDLCDHRLAALPGPRWRRGRPEPPSGFRVGYEVEMGDRAFPICYQCLIRVLQPAV